MKTELCGVLADVISHKGSWWIRLNDVSKFGLNEKWVSELSEEDRRENVAELQGSGDVYVSPGITLKRVSAFMPPALVANFAADLFAPKDVEPKEWVDNFARQQTPRRLDYLSELRNFMRHSGELAGIGALIAIDEKTDEFIISSLVENGPAFESGRINVADTILRIDGNPVKGKSLSAMRDMLVGEPGSKVVVTTRNPKGQESTVELTRSFQSLDLGNTSNNDDQGSIDSDRRGSRSSLGGGEIKISTSGEIFTRAESTSGTAPDTQYLKDLVKNFLVIGRETSEGTLTWLTYKLLSHPEILEDVCSEIILVYEHGGIAMTTGGAERVEFMAKMVDETLAQYGVDSLPQVDVFESAARLRLSLQSVVDLYSSALPASPPRGIIGSSVWTGVHSPPRHVPREYHQNP